MLRPYRDDSDYFRMRRFLQAGWQLSTPSYGLYHVGDITWGLFRNPRETMRPEEEIALCERPDGELDGFVWYFPKGSEAAMQIDPRLQGTPAWTTIANAMLTWADGRHQADAARTEPLNVPGLESDQGFAAYLTTRGFARSDATAMRFHHRSLSETIPVPALPDGFVIRPIDPDTELEERVEIHREVWHPSKFTAEGYRQLRASPGYDPDLDLVAVAPDGTFAAYTICWLDEVNGSGEFEPVGARAAFRRQGLTREVMYEGMRRLRARGCNSAYVLCYENNLAACALYPSAGFLLKDRWVSFQRPAQ